MPRSLFTTLIFSTTACLLVNSCQGTPGPSLNAGQTVVNSANPLEKEGQIIQLELNPKDSPNFNALPKTPTGLVDTSNLPFRILSNQNQKLAEGTIKENRIQLDPLTFQNTLPPYTLQVDLPSGQSFSAQIQKLTPGQTLTITARDLFFQNCQGDKCMNIGVINNEVKDNKIEGSLCVGICTINSSEEKKKSES